MFAAFQPMELLSENRSLICAFYFFSQGRFKLKQKDAVVNNKQASWQVRCNLLSPPRLARRLSLPRALYLSKVLLTVELYTFQLTADASIRDEDSP